MTRKSDLPFGSEFSPSNINLSQTLGIINDLEGDISALEAEFKRCFFAENQTTETNKRKLAMNLRLSLQAYGLVDAEGRFTDFGNSLYEIRDDEAGLYDALARHILLNLHGLNLIQCIRDIELAGENVTLLTLRQWLQERGIHFPRGGKHPSMMRLWLEKAGVFRTNWHINESRVRVLVGIGEDDLDVLARMTPEQKAFLKSLANLGGGGPYQSNEIEKLATATYGMQFNEKALPKTVLYPLEEAGLIELMRGTKRPGRGAKPFEVTTTERFEVDVLLPVLKQLEQQTHADLRPLLRKPLTGILTELTVDNTYLRGLALEALAFRLMRSIGLDYVATRLRGSATGGAEVDLIFESTRLVYSRWQIQCKNAARVNLDEVAKEVGLTHFLKSNVIVIVSTGQIGPAAHRYANRVMSESNLAIVMIDQADIQSIAENPPHIIEVLFREAKHAMQLKILEL